MSYQSTILADSPAVYWQLGETSGTTALDSSVAGTNTGTYNGTFTLNQTGPFAGAKSVLFDGSTGVIKRVGTPVAANNTTTLEGWFNTTDVTQGLQFVLTNGSDSTGYTIILNGNLAGISVSLLLNNVQFQAVPASIVNGTWYYLAATFGPTTAILYLNGTQVSSVNSTSGNVPTGVYASGNNVGTRYFKGYLSQLAVYGSILTPTRIAAHYAAGIAPPGGVFPFFIDNELNGGLESMGL